MIRLLRGVSICCTLLFLLSTNTLAEQPSSMQLVGNFNGISCEPEDTENDMVALGNHRWRKVKFINEPADPDTIFFKFTRDHSFLPDHWGWSGVEGIAKLDYNPPSIAAILPDTGYHYFFFDDTTYAYWLNRPGGRITGVVSTSSGGPVPAGTAVTLFDSSFELIGTWTEFSDSTAPFEYLPPAVYNISAQAPGYRDTMITDISLGEDESIEVPIELTSNVGVAISAAFCTRTEGGVLLTWKTNGYSKGFDIYRGTEPHLISMEKRNTAPVRADLEYEYFDLCENPAVDLYYYLIESEGDDPTIYGPLFSAGATPALPSTLGQNYPNPFNPATTMPYSIGMKGTGKPIRISFFDVAGRMIESHDIGPKPIGQYTFRWNPSLSAGKDIPSGVYYCRLVIGKESFTRKLILLR